MIFHVRFELVEFVLKLLEDEVVIFNANLNAEDLEFVFGIVFKDVSFIDVVDVLIILLELFRDVVVFMFILLLPFSFVPLLLLTLSV